MTLQRILLSLLFLLGSPFLSGTIMAKELQVLTSITPLQLIASEILQDVAQPDVLLPPGASPHQYALRPSDISKVHAADLIFWIGPDLERFLEKSLKQTDATVITLLHQDNMDNESIHKKQETETKATDSSSEAAISHSDEHEHGGSDPHIWLDPIHALEIAETIRDAAVIAAPTQQVTLDKNYNEFAAALLSLDKKLSVDFLPLQERPFIVFHDAYHGFVSHYGLLQKDAITVNPSRKAGAKHLAELRDAIINSQAVCIFSEPQFSYSILQTITAGTEVKTAELDPLGQQIQPGKGSYMAFLTGFAQVFKECLE